MTLACIVAAGMTKIGKRENLSARELFLEAFLEVMNDTPNLSRKDIEAVYVGCQSEAYDHQIMYGSLMTEWAGLLPSGSMRVEGCAASGALAFRLAVLDVMSGLHDVVLAAGVEKMSYRTTQEVTDILMAAADLVIEQWNGLTFPSIYAMMATEHMLKHGTTEEDMALVAVKNHKNAVQNPKAHLRKAVTVSDVLTSRPVAWPLKLYDCSPISDGAAVVVVTKPKLARRFTDIPVKVEGSGLASDTLGLYSREEISWPSAAVASSSEAYRMARIRPGQIDVAEVHDAFTINEIILMEALRFAPRGQGAKLIREGMTEIGGKVSVNPSGGLKARGHPIGATGLCQIYEAVEQLTGEAEKRQVPKAEIALTLNEGGSNAVVCTNVLRR